MEEKVKERIDAIKKYQIYLEDLKKAIEESNKRLEELLKELEGYEQ